MGTRRDFIKNNSLVAASTLLVPRFANAFSGIKMGNVGIQLYTVRKEMEEDAVGTLEKLAKIGFKELEFARSAKGNYYGLAAKEAKKITRDLGMTIRSGHVQVDKDWQQSVDAAAEAGQEYLICASMPSRGQTVENYQKCAETFNKAGEDCKKVNVVFGYHNHEAEFERVDGQVLYDILLNNTDPGKVKMEMDLGWIIMAGHDPFDYFKKYPGRFPLWHLKDMDKAKMQSTEFGKGMVDIPKFLVNAKKSGLKYFFLEQEEYANNAMESIQYDFDYLMKLKKG